MSHDWGPHFIVPSESTKQFSGTVLLRENLNRELLGKELESLGISGAVVRINNPWYFRRKGTESWILIGESDEADENFPVRWDTTGLQAGEYEVLGLMHVYVKKDNNEKTIARQSIVDVSVKN
jgi:hypothetical protein